MVTQEAVLTFETGCATHVGRVRSRNEDDMLARPEIGLWAVADGMGGHDAGDIASATVIDALRTIGRPSSAAELLARCESRIVNANARLLDIAQQRGVPVIGSTVAVLLAYGGHYACVWSGDSRVYRIRGGAITQVSRDHNEVQALVANGMLTDDEARRWPGRNAITRAIGVHDHPELEIRNGVLQPGDTFVICSDGLTGHVEDHEIMHCVRRTGAQQACDALVSLTLDRGATDNVTVIVSRYQPGFAAATTVFRPVASRGDPWE